MTPSDRVAAAVAELADALREQLRAEFEARQAEPPALLDVDAAARRIGISRTTLYSLADRPGGVPSLHVGRRRLFRRADLDAFADAK
jgi:excisionase family DNA binding protein